MSYVAGTYRWTIDGASISTTPDLVVSPTSPRAPRPFIALGVAVSLVLFAWGLGEFIRSL